MDFTGLLRSSEATESRNIVVLQHVGNCNEGGQAEPSQQSVPGEMRYRHSSKAIGKFSKIKINFQKLFGFLDYWWTASTGTNNQHAQAGVAGWQQYWEVQYVCRVSGAGDHQLLDAVRDSRRSQRRRQSTIPNERFWVRACATIKRKFENFVFMKIFVKINCFRFWAKNSSNVFLSF